jgi:hypothetical protein
MEKNCLIIDEKKFYDTKSIYEEYKNRNYKYDGEIKFIETNFPVGNINKKYIVCDYIGDAKFTLRYTDYLSPNSGIMFLYSHGPIYIVCFEKSDAYQWLSPKKDIAEVNNYIYEYIKNYVSDITGINCLTSKSGRYDNIILNEEKIDDAKILENKLLIVGTRDNNIIFRRSMYGHVLEKFGENSVLNLNLPIQVFAVSYYYSVRGKNVFISNAEEVQPENLFENKKLVLCGENKIYILFYRIKHNAPISLMKRVPKKFIIRKIDRIDVDILNYHLEH